MEWEGLVCKWWTDGMWKHITFVRPLKVEENSHHKKSHKIAPNYDGNNTSAHVWLGMEQYKDFGNVCTQDESSMELHYAAKGVLGRLWMGQYLCIQCCFTRFCSPH